MSKTLKLQPLALASALVAHTLGTGQACAAADLPPRVSILWPVQGDVFSTSVLVKIKADAADADGSITQVQFFANTNLVGVVTNPPFNIIWEVRPQPPAGDGPWVLKAIATDNLGASTESAPVAVYDVTGLPPWPVVAIASPRDRELFAVPATFTFSAELLATATPRLGAVEFFLNTNSVGVVTQAGTFSASTPLYSVLLTNLLEGDYDLGIAFYGDNGGLCPCMPRTIHVVKFGIQFPRLSPSGQLQFEVVTSFRKIPTIIEASPDLQDWFPIATNPPSGSSFVFTDPAPSTNGTRFYRAVAAF